MPGPSKLGQLSDQTRLLRALSTEVLKTSEDGDCTTSLDKPVSLLECLRIEKVSEYLLFQHTSVVKRVAPSSC